MSDLPLNPLLKPSREASPGSVPEVSPQQSTEPPGAPRYRPIEDYALIGDCHGAALIASDGSIDWATLDRFDADPVFCRLLDADKGGFWQLRPQASFTSTRAYLPDTNILRTVFTTGSGEVAVTDFMPVGRQLDAGVDDYVHLNAPAWIVRRVDGLVGKVEMESIYRPSRNWARAPNTLEATDGVVRDGAGMPNLHADLAFEISGDRSADGAGDIATATFQIGAGERRDLLLAGTAVAGEPPAERIDEFFEATQAFWEEWIGYCRYRGEYENQVRRSALALKLLTFAPTGAIVAAPTTSLPEGIGGERNWDYRYCWVRDSSFALYALAVLGYSGEAECFHQYILRAVASTLPEIRPMYAVDGTLKLEERVLEHLEGYRGSAPVNIGNGAYMQRQIDVYGQILDLSLMYDALGGKLDEQYRRLLRAVAKFIAAHWREPDQGIWEMRGPARHHVHGKLMSWVGLDRAAKLLGDEWADEAAQVAADIHAHGISPQTGGLMQAYDGGTDAAVLLAPMLGFELSAAALEATIADVRAALGKGPYFDRYVGEDGLSGEEGAFLVCTSWMIDAELACGHTDKARAAVEHLLGCANDVGLLAEEVDASTGAFLGNFPQALTHLGLIGNIVNLQLAERHGTDALMGSYADRTRLAVTATFGWRGVVAFMRQSGHLARVVSSKRSKLAWP